MPLHFVEENNFMLVVLVKKKKTFWSKMNQTQSGEQLDSEFLYFFVFLLPLMNDNENRKEEAAA